MLCTEWEGERKSEELVNQNKSIPACAVSSGALLAPYEFEVGCSVSAFRSRGFDSKGGGTGSNGGVGICGVLARSSAAGVSLGGVLGELGDGSEGTGGAWLGTGAWQTGVVTLVVDTGVAPTLHKWKFYYYLKTQFYDDMYNTIHI